MWTHLNVEIHYFVRRETFPGWEIHPRQISDHELVFVTGGSGNIVIAGKKRRVGEGDLICFRPGVEHSLCADTEPCMAFYGIHFGLPQGVEELPLPDVAQIPPRRLEPLLRSLREAAHQQGPLVQWRKNLLLEQVICEAMLALQASSEPMQVRRIRRVLAYIHEDPCRELTMDQLLEQAGIRKTAFIQAFRNVTGTTPLQYIQGLRLEYACDLLCETDLPVAQVAQRCGFSDSFYFSRYFRKKYGMPPSRWRQTRE